MKKIDKKKKMNGFIIELENGREIEYGIIDNVWQKLVCPYFCETMKQKIAEEPCFNINYNCGCCEKDNQLIGKHMKDQFKLALETICELSFDELSADDFFPIKLDNQEFISEERTFSACICTHNIEKQLYIKYIPKDIVIKIGSECIKTNMPTAIRDKIFNQIKQSRSAYKNRMKEKYEKIKSDYFNYKFNFGKYKGKNLNQVPCSYKDWILSVEDPSENFLKIQNIIKAREEINGMSFSEWFTKNKSINY